SAVIEAESHIALEISETKRNHSPGKCDYAGAGDYTQNAEQRTFRDFARHRRGGGLRDSDRRIAGDRNGGGGHDLFHQWRVRTVTTAERPGRNSDVSDESSRAIFTGTRCTTLVKLPVALSGGSNANCDPLAGAISNTLALKTLPG